MASGSVTVGKPVGLEVSVGVVVVTAGASRVVGLSLGDMVDSSVVAVSEPVGELSVVVVNPF